MLNDKIVEKDSLQGRAYRNPPFSKTLPRRVKPVGWFRADFNHLYPFEGIWFV